VARQKQLEPDPAGMERAVRRAAMPADLLVPIGASNLAAISKFIGRNIQSVTHTRNDNAICVETECGPNKSDLKVWLHPRADILNCSMQLWVRPAYSGYRKAFKRTFPDVSLGTQVIHHVMNRRYATLHGFEYVRVVAISRSANSSSGYTENWGVNLTNDGILRSRKGLAAIAYADLSDMMSMLEIPIGGGVMDTVQEAVQLLQRG